MLRYLHHLSAFFFYVLGSSFFVAYILLRNNVYPVWSALWLQVADLPFALTAVLYGGISLYLSLRNPEGTSQWIAWLIGIPLIAVFGVIVCLNFWGKWPI